MKTIIGARRNLGAVGHGGIEVYIPSHVPARDSSRDDARVRPPVASKIAAWATSVVRDLLRLLCAYLPWGKDAVPGWDATIKAWNALGVSYDKARPPSPKAGSHHSHGAQTDF